jgi:hypothetical protein
MHAAEFHEVFNGLTQTRIAELFDTTPRNFRRWARGERRVPRGITILVRLLSAGAVTIAEVEAAAFPVAARTNGGAPSAPVEPEPEQARANLSPAALAICALTSETCRWPIGDLKQPDFRFCARPAAKGQPYCEEHDTMAHMPRSRHDVANHEIRNPQRQLIADVSRKTFDGPELVAVT